MLQHVPVAWENAHPVIHTDDVDGVPDRLFKTYFGGHTAYTALLACDKLGLNPNQLLLRSRRAFRSAASDGRINLSIEGRRPGLDEDSQATIRYIIHERKRQMLFVQLFSVRRALVETGTVGPLWQQRQRFVTGKEAPPLNPPPLPEPLEENKNNNSGNINSNVSTGNNKHVRPGDTTGPIQLGRKSLNHSPGNNNNNNGNAKNASGALSSPDRRSSSRNSEVLPPPAVNSNKNKNNNDNDDDDDINDNDNEKKLDVDNWEDQLNQLQRTGSINNTVQHQQNHHHASPRSNGSSRRQSGHPQSAASGGIQNISTLSSSPGNSSSSPQQLQDHLQTGRVLLLSSVFGSKNGSVIGAGGSHSSNGENSNQLQHQTTTQNFSGDQTTLSSSASSPPPLLNPSALLVPYKRKQKITHSSFPVVPEPAPLFRWRTNDTLDKEEQFLSEACSRLVLFCNNFLRAEQSRLHEQLTIQQEDVEERRRKREIERKLHMEQLKTGGVNTSNMTLLNQDEENSFLANPSLMGFAKTSRSDSARPSTAGNVSTIPNGTPTNPNTTSASPDFDTSSDDDDEDDDEGAVRKKQKELFARPTTVGGQCHVAKTPSSYLWTLGESPFSVAGTRPPRPPTQRQQLVTKFGKIVGDDYVSTTVSRHLKIIAKKAAEHISDTVQGNAKDDEIREEMHKFHEERKLTKTKITGPLLGRGFEHANELTEAEQRRMALDYHNETLTNERINKLVTRHGKQEERKLNIDERKLTSHALQREVGQVRRENVKSNRDRIDHLEQARKLVMQVSREGRQERVDLLYQQHRAAAWNSRVSHEMEAMIRAQVKDKVKSMQLTRRWELGELPSAEELAEIFHSGLIMPSWNEGISEGIAPLRQKALEEEERIRREEELLALQQKQQEQKMLDRVGAVTELQMGSNKNNANSGSGTVMLPNINSNNNNNSNNNSGFIKNSNNNNSSSSRGGNIPLLPPPGSANQSRRSGGRSATEEVNWK